MSMMVTTPVVMTSLRLCQADAPHVKAVTISDLGVCQVQTDVAEVRVHIWPLMAPMFSHAFPERWANKEFGPKLDCGPSTVRPNRADPPGELLHRTSFSFRNRSLHCAHAAQNSRCMCTRS